MLRVLLADDHPIVVEGLLALLATEPDIEVVAACRDGHELLAALRERDADVLLLDQSMPGLSGTAVIRQLAESGRLPRTILLTGTIAEDEAVEAVRLGVMGIVLKEEAPRLLLETIRTVARGERRLEARLVQRAYGPATGPGTGAGAARLTAAELKIVRLVCRGLPNKHIAHELAISEATVKIHLHRVFRKLNVSNRVQLTIRAHQGGFA